MQSSLSNGYLHGGVTHKILRDSFTGFIMLPGHRTAIIQLQTPQIMTQTAGATTRAQEATMTVHQAV